MLSSSCHDNYRYIFFPFTPLLPMIVSFNSFFLLQHSPDPSKSGFCTFAIHQLHQRWYLVILVFARSVFSMQKWEKNSLANSPTNATIAIALKKYVAKCSQPLKAILNY